MENIIDTMDKKMRVAMEKEMLRHRAKAKKIFGQWDDALHGGSMTSLQQDEFMYGVKYQGAMANAIRDYLNQ